MLITVSLVLILENLWLLFKIAKPNGILHIDEYSDKDAYRMLYFTPLEDLKKYRRLVLSVEVRQWNELSGDFEADFIPKEYL